MYQVKMHTAHLNEGTKLIGVQIDEKTFLQLPYNFTEAVIKQNPEYRELRKRPKYRKYDNLDL
jgi:hypothetical protein